MTFRDWIRNTRGHISRSGFRAGGKAAALEFYTGAALRAYDRLPHWGRDNILDQEWDVCIVLDACRVDALNEVVGEYDWLDTPSTITSTGSMSEEWMEETFTPEYSSEMARCGHVTWNAFSSHCLDEADWVYLDEMWRDNWVNERGSVPPNAVTDQAIARWRTGAADRMIVHYQQPHTPYRMLAGDGTIETLKHEYVGDKEEQGRLTVWKLLRRGDISRERAWGAYIDNLRWVLDDIERLRENLDADQVVLTADHGDCFGEYGLYGHPRGVPVEELIRVPWVEIPTADRSTHTPSVKDHTDGAGGATERLEALGYI